MKRTVIVISMSLMLFMFFIFVLQLDAAPIQVGFIALGDEGPFTKPALEFAKKRFNAARLERKDLKSETFKKFAVVWWHDGDTDPGALTKPELEAFMDYAKAGGAVLFTAWAIRYVTPMGLENVEARQFGPVPTDGINVGITVLEETEKLGLKNSDY